MDEEQYVPSADDHDADDAAAMQSACIGGDLSDPGSAQPMFALATTAVYKSSSRDGAAVNLICAHTAEGARTARSLAAFFQRADVQASAHAGLDATETLPMVPYSRAAWTLRSGNKYSDNLEICGFARWTRTQWMSTGTVDGCANPRKMLDRAAAWIAARCKARGIPVRHLTHTQVRSYSKGVIHHDDWTKAMNDGTHWDCGPGFPWDYVLAKAQEDDMPSPRDWNDADKEVVGEALTAALIADPATDKDRPFATWVRYHFAREGSVDALRSEVASLKAAVAELGQNPGGGATKAEVEAAVAPVMAKLTELDFLQPGK